MGYALRLSDFEDATMSDVPALLNADPWATASAEQRRVADMRYMLIEPYARRLQDGASIAQVAKLILAQKDADYFSFAQAQATADLYRGLSLPNLQRWLSDYKRLGKVGLLSKHTGRVRKDYGWEQDAARLFNIPSKPSYKAVALRLKALGNDSADESRVRRYLQSLPATMGKLSPQRVGPHLHKLTRRTYQKRNLDELLVGEMYAGDGHTCDCYVLNPANGAPMRPELTAFIDVKTGYIAGWYWSESESGVSTLYALSHAMISHDHVPAWLYIDRGAGYRSKMLTDESTGYYKKFDIEIIGAIAGNPHGKGWIERWFRTLRDRHDKFFDDGLAYCGDDAADETNRRMSPEVRSGKRKLKSLAQYIDSVNNWIVNEYHHTVLEQRGDTPANMWKGLAASRIPVELSVDAVVRPWKLATVFRQRVTIDKRDYFHSALAMYDAKKIKVEYDLHNDGKVWLYDDKERFIAEAVLCSTIGVLPISRLEEQRDKRLVGQTKRLERRLALVHAARHDAITTNDVMADIEALELHDPIPKPPQSTSPKQLQGKPTTHPALPAPVDAPQPKAKVIEIDITDYED